MALTVPIAALLGLGTAIGGLLIAYGLVAHTDQTTAGTTPLPAWLTRAANAAATVDRRRAALCLAVAVVVAVLTRWPVAAVLAGIAAWVLPHLLGPDRGHNARVDRVEAIAVWTESLRDNLSAAAGLHQALVASAVESPEPIRAEVSMLATRLRRGVRLPSALTALADELADPTADLVVAGLQMAARGSASQLADVLGELAASARAKVASRQRIAAGRRRTRTSARVIVAATLLMAGGLALLNRGYLRPYDTPVGQLVLLAAGGCFAAAFWWLGQLMRDRDTARILAPTRQSDQPMEEVIRS